MTDTLFPVCSVCGGSGRVERPDGSLQACVCTMPDFDGATYARARDHQRLGAQLLRVGRVMLDGEWHTLREIATATGDPEASVSARLRDLRKSKFGGRVVEREFVSRGLWRYRLLPAARDRVPS